MGSKGKLDLLPVRPTRFFGRDSELETIRKYLLTPDIRLLTLTGPPGIGKTRLAVEAAVTLRQHFVDGVVFVDLVPIRDPALVASAIAQRLGLPTHLQRSALEQLVRFLRGRRVLLLLDNFEQVVDAALMVADLLRRCPPLSILATSREALRIDWEHEYPVLPLALPDLARAPLTEPLMPYPAIALFVDRAQAVFPRFLVDHRNLRTIAEICTHLEGLPLAIEMAAALIQVLSPQAMSERLAYGHMRLTASVKNLPDRHQTLRDAILWSYNLLNPSEQKLFRRLAVFVGGCTLDAAEAVCGDGGGERADVLFVLVSLVRKNLLQQAPQPDDQGRYRMLESIREFGVEQLLSTGELQAMQRRHAGYFLAFVERAEPALHTQAQSAWLNHLEWDHDNLREVLRWSTNEAGGRETGLRMAGALYWFWWVRGYVADGSRWLETLLASDGEHVDPAVRAKACYAAGFLLKRRGDLDGGRRFGDVSVARRFTEESMMLWQQLGEPLGAARALVLLGAMQREPVRARSLWEEGLALCRQLGDRLTSAYALNGLGEVARFEGDLQRARAFYEDCLSIWREAGHSMMVAVALFNLAQTVMRQGDLRLAESYFRESASLQRQLGSQYATDPLMGLAEVAIRGGYAVRAAQLFGAVDALSMGLEGYREDLNPPDQAEFGASITMTRAALTEEEFASAWSEGRSWTLEQALEFAMAPPPKLAEGEQTSRRNPLTYREQEVAQLIAEGRSNREIAGKLHIAERTAEKHVENILNRLGFDSRAQIAAWTVEHRLTASTRRQTINP